MLELIGLFVVGLFVLFIIAVVIPVVGIIRTLDKLPSQTAKRASRFIRYVIAALLVCYYPVTALIRCSQLGPSGPYQLVSALKLIPPKTYSQYKLILNTDNTFQAIKLPPSVTLCITGKFEVEDLPDGYHQINFSCTDSYHQVSFESKNNTYQIVFNVEPYGGQDRSRAVVFERTD